jgi:DNA (cytosine-5)-methyltransferase 1
MITTLHYQTDLFCHDPHHAPHDHELVIDNFAGGGGASIGISKAVGRSVDIAINHDVEALAMHQANHPETRHYCENILEIDPVKVCAGRPVGMAWFSPDCTHHSKAKGGKPRKKEIRALAWVVVKWAAKVRPRVIFLENVEEFQDWCPLDSNCQPIKERKGETFRLWVGQLEALGYVVEWRLLSAHDYGAPTTRKRLFLVARCDGQPITWPKPTHGKAKGLKPYRTAAECLDFSIPCPSIFLSKEEARTMGVIRPLAENTLRRIAKGLKRYVLDDPNPFIIAYHSQETFRGQGIDEPLRTQTTENRFGLVSPYLVGIDNKSSGDSGTWGPKEPVRTITTENRFTVVAPTLVQTGYGERPGQAPRCLDLQKPLGTVVAGGAKHALVSTFIAKHYGGVVGHDVERPLGTVTTVDHHSLVSAFMEKHASGARLARKDVLSAFFVKYYGCGDGAPVTEPMHTITTKDRFGLVQVQGQDYEIVDIGLRMLQPRELARAQGMPEDYKLPGTKTRQVRCIGNSVSPPPAEALVRANYKPASVAMGATA